MVLGECLARPARGVPPGQGGLTAREGLRICFPIRSQFEPASCQHDARPLSGFQRPRCLSVARPVGLFRETVPTCI
jgi:hypothetical protein